jgi:hypothetical protein
MEIADEWRGGPKLHDPDLQTGRILFEGTASAVDWRNTEPYNGGN